MGLSDWVVENHRCSYVSDQRFFFFLRLWTKMMDGFRRQKFISCVYNCDDNVVILIIYITLFLPSCLRWILTSVIQVYELFGLTPSINWRLVEHNVRCIVFSLVFLNILLLRSHWYYVCICTTFSLPRLNLITETLKKNGCVPKLGRVIDLQELSAYHRYTSLCDGYSIFLTREYEIRTTEGCVVGWKLFKTY